MPDPEFGPSIDPDDLIDIHEPLLRRSWSTRRSDRDVLLLGDTRAPSFAQIARESLGPEAVDAILAGGSSGGSTWLACSCGPEFIEQFRRAGGFENRSLSDTLASVARADAGLVPLLVVSVNRAFATGWAPSGCGVAVVRISGVTVEAN